jgi:TonB family protein
MDGRFSVAANRQTLTTVTASYVGMKTGDYQLSADSDNRLVMQPDMAALNEVVVIGNENRNEIYSNGAEPEGGLKAYEMYMEQNIRFPAGDSTRKREVVVLRFTVEANGTISHVESLRSPGISFTDEAMRLLMEGPPWSPAMDENGPVSDVVRMRILFKK